MSKLVKCPKCASTEIYGTRTKKEYFSVNNQDREYQEEDIFNSELVNKKPKFHCYKCETEFFSKDYQQN